MSDAPIGDALARERGLVRIPRPAGTVTPARYEQLPPLVVKEPTR